MRKIIALLLAGCMLFSLAACGGTQTEQASASSDGDIPSEVSEEQYAAVGDTVSTDIFSFTLDSAALAIALDNTVDENYFLPKEFDAQQDSDNPYVAPKGHTFAAFTYTVTNLDRASAEFHDGSFASVEYDGVAYSRAETPLEEGAYMVDPEKKIRDIDGSMQTIPANEWQRGASNNLLLSVGAKETRRSYLDIPVEANSLSDEFKLTISIPTSDGSKTDFTYWVKAE